MEGVAIETFQELVSLIFVYIIKKKKKKKKKKKHEVIVIQVFTAYQFP